MFKKGMIELSKKSLDKMNEKVGSDSQTVIVTDTNAVTASGETDSANASSVSGFEVVCDGKQTYVNGVLLNRMNDSYSKFVFANEPYKDTTLSLINGVFELEGKKKLVDFEFKDRELDPDTLGGKGVLLDVRGTSSDGTLVNVEIQLSNLKSMDRRTLYYWALLYGRRLQGGEDYKNLNRTVVISILAYNLFDKESWPHYHSCFAVLNTKEVNHKLSDDLEIHFVELPKWHKGNLCKLNSLERWLAYLSPDTTDEERRQLAMEDAAIGTAMKAEKVFLSNSDYLTAYERQQKYLRDMRAMKEAARDEGLEEGREAGYTEGREAGFTAGLAEGHAEGHAEGRAEGRAEGLAEGEAKAMKKSVLALHRKGKSDSEIAELLELSLAEVQTNLCQEEK